MRKIISVLVVLIFAVSFVGNVPKVQAAEPSLAQCQGEPSKGTGWGTFWMVIGGLNMVGGAVNTFAAGSIADDDDDYYYDDEGLTKGTVRTIGIVSMVVGGGLMGLGIGMRSSANNYNEACSNLLSYKSVKPGVGLEPIAKEATGMRLVYRW